MEDVSEKITRIVGPSTINSLVPNSAELESYKILEDADMFGFSHPNIDKNTDRYGYERCSLIECFKEDDNWNNPENVSLMMKAYDITDPYASFCCKSDLESAFRYLEIRKAQHKMFSDRLMEEGKVSLNHLKLAESIAKFNDSLKYDEENVNAYLCRAETYARLRDMNKAKMDVIRAMQVDPHLTILENDLLRAVYNDIVKEIEERSLLGKRRSFATNHLEEEEREQVVSRLEQSLLASSPYSCSDRDSEDGSISRKHKRRKIKHKKKHKSKHKRHKSKDES